MLPFILGYYLTPKSHTGSTADPSPLASIRIQQGSEYSDSESMKWAGPWTERLLFFFLSKTNQEIIWILDNISRKIMQPKRDRPVLFTWVLHKCLVIFKPRNPWRGIPRCCAWNFDGFTNTCCLILQVSGHHWCHTFYAHTKRKQNI